MKFKKSKFLITLSLTVFATSAILINPPDSQAQTITYTNPVKITVTTNNNSTSTTVSTNKNTSQSAKKTTTTQTKKTTSSTKTSSSTKNTSSSKTNSSTKTTESKNTDQVKKEKTVEKKTIAANTKYATDLYIIDSGNPGPVVMIVGGVHGNEPAGYKAANKVKDYNIKKGTLIVIPEANKLAIEAGRRSASGESDLNRQFPQSQSSSPSGTLSKALYNVVKEYKVDWLMDMHEGFDYYKNSSTSSVGQTLIYYPANGTKSTVEYIVNSLNKDISSSIQKFTLLRYPVKGSLARSAGEYLGVNSFIFETSMKQTLNTRINLQEKAATTLLSQLGML